MKYVVVYTSRTGNTRLIAETVKDELGSDATLVEFSMDMQVDKAAMLFIGYWCDKGTCSIELTQWISTLHGRKIALFGTAGFGGGWNTSTGSPGPSKRFSRMTMKCTVPGCAKGVCRSLCGIDMSPCWRSILETGSPGRHWKTSTRRVPILTKGIWMTHGCS